MAVVDQKHAYYSVPIAVEHRSFYYSFEKEKVTIFPVCPMALLVLPDIL